MGDPVVAPWGILFDWDGRKTDEFMHGEDEEVPDPDPYGSPYSSYSSGGGPPDPGGYLEESNFGLGTTWHSYNGPDLHGHEAIEYFNQFSSDPRPEPWH